MNVKYQFCSRKFISLFDTAFHNAQNSIHVHFVEVIGKFMMWFVFSMGLGFTVFFICRWYFWRQGGATLYYYSLQLHALRWSCEKVLLLGWASENCLCWGEYGINSHRWYVHMLIHPFNFLLVISRYNSSHGNIGNVMSHVIMWIKNCKLLLLLSLYHSTELNKNSCW